MDIVFLNDQDLAFLQFECLQHDLFSMKSVPCQTSLGLGSKDILGWKWTLQKFKQVPLTASHLARYVHYFAKVFHTLQSMHSMSLLQHDEKTHEVCPPWKERMQLLWKSLCAAPVEKKTQLMAAQPD